MRSILIVGATLVAMTLPALAEDCTEDLANTKAEELSNIIQADPSKGEKMDVYIAEVEAEYGGEPSAAQTCEAIDKLIAKLQAGN